MHYDNAFLNFLYTVMLHTHQKKTPFTLSIFSHFLKYEILLTQINDFKKINVHSHTNGLLTHGHVTANIFFFNGLK